MSEIIGACVTSLNSIGRGFCNHAAGMFFQTAVLVAMLLVLDVLLRTRIRATLRYWIWMLVFVKLLLPPGLCAPTGIGYWCGKYAPASPPASQQLAGVTVPIPASVELPARAELPVSQPSAPDAVPMVDESVEHAPGGVERLTWQGVAFVFWGAGVLVFGAVLVQRLLFVRRLIAQGESAGGDLVDTLDRCRRRVGVRREVALLLSANAFSPAVCGFCRPVILMPARLPEELPADGVEAVLIHELAHLKRRDIWINCVQTVLQIVYFYNPLVWLAGAMVRRVREQAVDETVLVALGAEAQSYSRTLIKIAETAFLRASPALRLLGMAESRKSLEGRIRHMITRPMPKSARMGVARGLIVAAIGAVLLPMAAAGTKTIGQPPFTATLPNGVTVELVGVCNWPAGEPVCWKADGSPLDKPLHVTKWKTRPGANHYGFMVRIAGPNDLNRSWNRIEGSDGWEAGCDVVDAQGNRLEGHTAAVALVKEGTTQTTLQLGFATGPWSTISTHDGERMSLGQHTGVLWSQMFQDPRGVFIVATAEYRRERTRRIIAIDTEGAMHVGQGGSVAADHMDQSTYYFPRLRPDQVKELQYQIRPFEWVEFRNVSLRPGVKTDIEVSVDTAGSKDYASVTVHPGVGFDDIIAANPKTTIEHVKSKLGPPDQETDRWLGYHDKYGLDFWFYPSGGLAEIRMNPGFRGRLPSGISLASSKAEVFQRYGQPVEERQVDDLHRKNDERVLYTRGDMSRIHYGEQSLIFWFTGDAISQIVTFAKSPGARSR